jgi:hypothetical protein
VTVLYQLRLEFDSTDKINLAQQRVQRSHWCRSHTLNTSGPPFHDSWLPPGYPSKEAMAAWAGNFTFFPSSQDLSRKIADCVPFSWKPLSFHVGTWALQLPLLTALMSLLLLHYPRLPRQYAIKPAQARIHWWEVDGQSRNSIMLEDRLEYMVAATIYCHFAQLSHLSWRGEERASTERHFVVNFVRLED